MTTHDTSPTACVALLAEALATLGDALAPEERAALEALGPDDFAGHLPPHPATVSLCARHGLSIDWLWGLSGQMVRAAA